MAVSLFCFVFASSMHSLSGTLGPLYMWLPLSIVVQSLSPVWLCDPMDSAHQASLSFTISWSLLRLMSIESVMLSNHLILCHPLLLSSICPSIRVFSHKSALRIRWPKYGSFSICPFNEYPGLISFWMDWFDLLAIQRTLKSLFQHHNLKTSVLQHSAFFMIQLLHPYMTTRKTIALTIHLMLLNCGIGEDSWESLGLWRDQTSPL